MLEKISKNYSALLYSTSIVSWKILYLYLLRTTIIWYYSIPKRKLRPLMTEYLEKTVIYKLN